jgi:small subunit ribosomal protein S21
MVFVKKSQGDSADAMIRKFSRKVMSEGIIQEMKKREFHLKPSLAKKYRKQLARKFAKLNNHN